MSVLGLERSQTNAADFYDHAINLIDSTKPKADDGESNDDEPSGSISASRSTSPKSLERRWTKQYLRKELARRKYAKWQEKESNVSTAEASSRDGKPGISQNEPSKTNSYQRARLGDKVHSGTKKKSSKHNNTPESFVDVLYENQRGSFFCGIPLYSSNSLLNFDPAGWQTSNFQDSPVNITNAQVPDPSWQWVWRTWYVDMSYDVDEEGWQYSFSFGKGFAWHGNHPWFHSFVRRRRWLRKRIKVHPYHARWRSGNIREAHLLNADYFTIHSATRDRSRGSSADRTTNNRSGFTKLSIDGDNELSEIGDIAALMLALRRATVDREKIAAVKAFLYQGGDELFYLAEIMPTLMHEFVHQTSQRQVQISILQALDEATKYKQDEDDNSKEKENRQRIDNLLKAVHAAGVHTDDVEFWSDLRARATGSEVGPTNETHTLNPGKTASLTGRDIHAHVEEEEKSEIKGIPDSAQISEEPRIRFDTTREIIDNHSDGKVVDKGKGKA
ncbi:MAG: hypothetical protein Q9163_004522 [Psora crenata]